MSITEEEAVAAVIALNVEERIGWEAAAHKLIPDLKRSDVTELAVRALATEAMRTHRKSFDAPSLDEAPSVDALLAPIAAKLLDPLNRLIDGGPFAERNRAEITAWWETRHKFAQSVSDKHKAETELKERSLELLRKEKVATPADLKASSRFELSALARKALVD